MRSTEYLSLMAHNNLHVVLEYGMPRGKLKRDTATIKNTQGTDITLISGSYTASPVILPLEILNDLLVAHLLREAEEDSQGSTTFVLSDYGLTRGLASGLKPGITLG